MVVVFVVPVVLVTVTVALANFSISLILVRNNVISCLFNSILVSNAFSSSRLDCKNA